MNTGKSAHYIGHDLKVRDALVIAENSDGSRDIVLLSEDSKRQQRATSAEWFNALDRMTHIRPYRQKLKEAAEAENQAAVTEHRDADFGINLNLGCMPECLAPYGSVNTAHSAEGSFARAIVLRESEYDGLPEPYRVPREETAVNRISLDGGELPAGPRVVTTIRDANPPPPPTSGTNAPEAHTVPEPNNTGAQSELGGGGAKQLGN